MKKNKISRFDLIFDAVLIGALAMQWDMWNDVGPVLVNIVHWTIATGVALNLFNATERVVKAYTSNGED